MKVLLTGGGTLGPVTPLLAVAEELQQQSGVVRGFSLARATLKGRTTQKVELLWIGTRRGPERRLVEDAGIKFSWIWAPKWRRYFDVRNVFAPLALHLATKIAWFKLLCMWPDVIVTAGGFVGVPFVWAAAWLRMFGVHIPCLLHNQDVRFSLANKLVAPFVKKITYALPGTVPVRWKKKSVWTGNPVRAFVLKGNREAGLKRCGFDGRAPTIMVIGGGTGAQRLNEIVVEALPELTRHYQVIHLAGSGKSAIRHSERSEESPTNVGSRIRAGSFVATAPQDDGLNSRYHTFEFVTSEIADLYAAADLVITRAGMGTLFELAALGKPMVIVPIPGSHQEENALYFEVHGAAVVCRQDTLTPEVLLKIVRHLMEELGTLQTMAAAGHDLAARDAARRVAQEVLGLVK